MASDSYPDSERIDQACFLITPEGLPRAVRLGLEPDGVHHRRGPKHWRWSLRIDDQVLFAQASEPRPWDPSRDLDGAIGTLAVAGVHPAADRTGLGNLWLGSRRYLPHDPVFPGAFPAVWEGSRRRVHALFDEGRLRVARPDAFRRMPARIGPETHDRVTSMLRGVAVGDALGNTSESLTATDRRALHGEIVGYLPNRHAHGRAIGLPSDDTQLTFRTLASMLSCGRLDTNDLAKRFRTGRIFGIGDTVRRFLGASAGVADPWDARQRSAGNGALMRVTGLLAPHAYFDASTDPRRRDASGGETDAHWTWDVLLGTALTHDDPTALGASMGIAAVLEALLRGGPEKRLAVAEMLDLFVATARIHEGEARLESRVPGSTWRGPCWRFVDGPVREALRGGVDTMRALQSWYSGAFLLETVPSVLFLLARYLDDPERCLLRAVNDTWDNDTIASICGAAMGARHGDAGFPSAWLGALAGRVEADDDGAIDRMLAELRALGGSTAPGDDGG